MAAARAFFERYFAFRRIQIGAEDSRVVLQGEGVFTLVLSSAASVPPPQYPGDFHVGFAAADVAAVGALHARMRADGVDLATEPQTFGLGTAFYGNAPGGVLFEVTALAPAHAPGPA